jgi:hypothetical protein
MSGFQSPGRGVELPDLNLHQGGVDAGDALETVPSSSAQEAKKRTNDAVSLTGESDEETSRSLKRPRLELENPGSADEDSSPSSPSEKAKGKRPARSPELEEVSPQPELDYVQEFQPDEPPQTQFDDRTQSPTVEPLTAYTCPICFGVVTNATMTPW